jgi:hypothetical protein
MFLLVLIPRAATKTKQHCYISPRALLLSSMTTSGRRHRCCRWDSFLPDGLDVAIAVATSGGGKGRAASGSTGDAAGSARLASSAPTTQTVFIVVVRKVFKIFWAKSVLSSISCLAQSLSINQSVLSFLWSGSQGSCTLEYTRGNAAVFHLHASQPQITSKYSIQGNVLTSIADFVLLNGHRLLSLQFHH